MPIPEFVQHLRSALGHELLWLSGVSGVVLDDDLRILLGRRADTGRWAVISGILEPGEEPAVAVVREVLEETGVIAEAVALTAVSTGHPMTYPNGDAAQYLDLCFWCRAVGGEATVGDDEPTEVGWFELDALPADLTESSVERIARTVEFVTTTFTDGHPLTWFARD